MYKSRLTLILGWLAAYELYNDKIKKSIIDQQVYDAIKKIYGEKTWFWGESATPLFLLMSKLAQKMGDDVLSNKIICDFNH